MGTLPADVSPSDIDGWSSEQLVAFLERLGELRAATPLSCRTIAELDRLYRLSGSRNAEQRCAWLRLRVDAGDVDALPAARAFLGEQGRMKYLRPLYRALKRNSKAFGAAAQEIFEHARGGYHPIAAKMVAVDLGVPS